MGKQAIDVADHQRVSDAVHKAESGTSGEIVTIVTERSDTYRDIALWWAAIAAALALAAIALFPDFFLPKFEWLTGHWDDLPAREVFGIAFTVAMLKFTGVWLLLQWMKLRLWLTPRAVKAARVRGRSLRYFRVGAEQRTIKRTGILVYLSLDERMAEIIGDEAINAKIELSVWGDAMARLISKAREGALADGMVAAVEDIGIILAAHFPRQDNDVNELPDRLIEL